MSDEEKIDPGHRKVLKVLRIGGPLVLVTGLVCTGAAFIDFVIATSHWGDPRLFWLAFIGMPLMFVGSAMTMFGFLGKIARFQAAQTAPVVKDTFNYMAEGTQEGVKSVARSITEGIVEGTSGKSDSAATVRCPACGFLETGDAKFCSGCGAKLETA